MLTLRSKRLATASLYVILVIIYLCHIYTDYRIARLQHEVTSQSPCCGLGNLTTKLLLTGSQSADNLPATNVKDTISLHIETDSHAPLTIARVPPLTVLLESRDSEQKMYEKTLTAGSMSTLSS